MVLTPGETLTAVARWLAGVRGAIGFFTRLSVGFDDESWAAFQEAPTAFPIAGYAVGLLLAPALLLPFPDPTVAVVFVAWVYLLTGLNHADGVADLGDAMGVHGDRKARIDAMRDVSVGAGGVLLLTVVVGGLALAGVALAGVASRAVGIVVAAEAGAKLGIVALAGLLPATHEGLASGFTDRLEASSVALPAVLSLPAAALTFPHPAAAAALVAGVAAALALGLWARSRLGGVSGDVLGAANDVGRVVSLHAGVIAWTRL
ncbi:MAG: adenosylcobinamide-GDP ribazoletransferase [Halobacteriales archaeon]